MHLVADNRSPYRFDVLYNSLLAPAVDCLWLCVPVFSVIVFPA